MRTDWVGDINRLQAFGDRRAAFAVPEDVTFLNSAQIRVAPHPHTTMADVGRFAAALRSAR